MSNDAAGLSPATPDCCTYAVQIIITLETEEVVHECWQAAARKSSGTAVMRKVGRFGCKRGLLCVAAGQVWLGGVRAARRAAAGCGAHYNPLPAAATQSPTPAVDCCCCRHKLKGLVAQQSRSMHRRAQQSTPCCCLFPLQVYDEHQELTPDTILTHFLFSLPVDAPPSFATQLVSLRWVLRFEFTAAHQSSSSWLGSRKPDQISWMLPIHVHVPC